MLVLFVCGVLYNIQCSAGWEFGIIYNGRIVGIIYSRIIYDRPTAEKWYNIQSKIVAEYKIKLS